MMAAVLYGRENLQVEPVAVPKIQSGDILVRVKAALTCGTDVKVFRRGEPLACVVRGLEQAAPLPGDTMAVIGLGPIGLMFVKLAKLAGCRVIAVGRRQTQLERAAALGADELIVAGEKSNPVKAIRAL